MLGVDDDGHRPVIDQSDPHMRAETTFLHRHSPGAQRLVELDPHEIGMLGLAGLDEARAIALADGGADPLVMRVEAVEDRKSVV